MGVKICPECNGKVAEARKTCPHCGYDFSSAKKKCPDCEEEIDAKLIECPHCGHEFVSVTPNVEVAQEEPEISKTEVSEKVEEDLDDGVIESLEAKKTIDEKAFMKYLLTTMSEDEKCPNDIMDAKFGEIEFCYKEIILTSSEVDMNFSCTIGYDRKEDYIAQEYKTVHQGEYYSLRGVQHYAPETKKYECDVVKTRTVTDWSAYNGSSYYETIEVAPNDTSFAFYGESLRSITTILKSIENDDFIDSSKIMEVSEFGLLTAKMAAVNSAIDDLDIPGDHYKDLKHNEDVTVTGVDCYYLPYYKVHYTYKGQEFVASGFACGKPNCDYIIPKNNVDLERDVRQHKSVLAIKRSRNFAIIVALVALLVGFSMGNAYTDEKKYPIIIGFVLLADAIILFFLAKKKQKDILAKYTSDNNSLKNQRLNVVLSELEARGVNDFSKDHNGGIEGPKKDRSKESWFERKLHTPESEQEAKKLFIETLIYFFISLAFFIGGPLTNGILNLESDYVNFQNLFTFIGVYGAVPAVYFGIHAFGMKKVMRQLENVKCSNCQQEYDFFRDVKWRDDRREWKPASNGRQNLYVTLTCECTCYNCKQKSIFTDKVFAGQILTDKSNDFKDQITPSFLVAYNYFNHYLGLGIKGVVNEAKYEDYLQEVNDKIRATRKSMAGKTTDGSDSLDDIPQLGASMNFDSEEMSSGNVTNSNIQVSPEEAEKNKNIKKKTMIILVGLYLASLGLAVDIFIAQSIWDTMSVIFQEPIYYPGMFVSVMGIGLAVSGFLSYKKLNDTDRKRNRRNLGFLISSIIIPVYLLGVIISTSFIFGYKVSYYGYDESFTVFKYPGEIPRNLKEPTKEGCAFAGWYLDEGFTESAEGRSIDGDVTLYPRWVVGVPSMITIVYDTKGGNYIPSRTIKNYCSGYFILYEGYAVHSEIIPIKEGYKFDGWYFDDDYTNKIEPPYTYTFKTELITVYAKWILN